MKFGWETKEERLRRFMKIPPKTKLEWLRHMSEFALQCLPRSSRQIRLRLRRNAERKKTSKFKDYVDIEKW